MYARRIQLTNYGPIDHVDIHFPFRDDGTPKPVVLVGENGSGKTLVLSHVVNALVAAKSVAFPDSPEVQSGKVYKVRSNIYIKVGRPYYFAKLDFDNDLSVGELRTVKPKGENAEMPAEMLNSDAAAYWAALETSKNDYYDSPLASHMSFDPPRPVDQSIIDNVTAMFVNQCVLYFPSSRFEEPAWLNEANIANKVQYLTTPRYVGSTDRRVVASSTLRDNQNWLLHVILDHFAQTVMGQLPEPGDDPSALFGTVRHILAAVLQRDEVLVGFGSRRGRALALVNPDYTDIMPNATQMSSGEAALSTLFLSILRDFDSTRSPFSDTVDVRGIVVIDEVDLHLHVRHQSDVLPRLIKMFPGVQFIVTTHSPLFVLGMRNTFEDDGFDIYRLPDGHQINAEEFSEFGEAYQAFAASKQFVADVQQRVLNAQKPILWVEGTTDERYLRAAAVQLDQSALLDRFELRDAGGVGKLKNIWTALDKLTKSSAGDMIQQVVILLHDPEYTGDPENNGRAYKRKMPICAGHPLAKGVENLFDRDTLDRARKAKNTFINIYGVRPVFEDGKEKTQPEEWDVNPSEKKNLCNWLCQNGDANDFRHFKPIFAMLAEVLRQADESV